tara:strand:- start:528 stop:692 length:165 start_codon:yes stop_codon:yes gene_type:complete
LIDAYIGGRNPNLSTPGILMVNNAATARGIAMDRIQIHTVYFFEVLVEICDILQ